MSAPNRCEPPPLPPSLPPPSFLYPLAVRSAPWTVRTQGVRAALGVWRGGGLGPAGGWRSGGGRFRLPPLRPLPPLGGRGPASEWASGLFGTAPAAPGYPPGCACPPAVCRGAQPRGAWQPVAGRSFAGLSPLPLPPFPSALVLPGFAAPPLSHSGAADRLQGKICSAWGDALRFALGLSWVAPNPSPLAPLPGPPLGRPLLLLLLLVWSACGVCVRGACARVLGAALRGRMKEPGPPPSLPPSRSPWAPSLVACCLLLLLPPSPPSLSWGRRIGSERPRLRWATRGGALRRPLARSGRPQPPSLSYRGGGSAPSDPGSSPGRSGGRSPPSLARERPSQPHPPPSLPSD